MANGSGDTRAFDEERAHRDFDASLAAGRAASQAAILINGGAATALLAYLAGKAGVPIAQGGVPVGVIRAACIAFLCYAGGVFLGALSMWHYARAGALFAWAGLDKLRDRAVLSGTGNTIRTGSYDEANYEAQRRARSAWFWPWDQEKRNAWKDGWVTLFTDRIARPAWFKVLFDQTMVGSNLEHARGHLSLQAAAFFWSLVLFLGATWASLFRCIPGWERGERGRL
jgi:hypothetical protein